MCCKNNCGQSWVGSAVSVITQPSIRRSRYELNLPNYVLFPQPPYFPLPDHRQDLITLNRSPRPLKGSESLARVHPPFDRPMVLLHDVVQVGTGTAATPATELVLPLQFRDHLRIGRIAVYIDHARAGKTRSPQGSLEEDFGRSCIPQRRPPEACSSRRRFWRL